ncbi:MAG: hypothetical protein IT462_15165 [Planctomycetes bacterium]|nr:hypothetical protein [Planctomycetota bacterium]
MRRLAGIALLLLLIAAPHRAQADDLETEAKSQVVKLGDNDWATREKAQRRLVAIGEPARKPLRAALEDKDPEIRVRASKALISLGESLGFAMESAQSASDGIRMHGMAALKHQLHIDDDVTLRKLGPNEINQYDRSGNSQSIQIQQPPIIAIARIEGLSGFPIFVSDQVKEPWKKLMETTTLTLYLGGDVTRLYVVIQAATGAFNAAVRDPKNMLVLNGMRCGRKDFIYVTSVNGQFDAASRCKDQLIADLLGGGPKSVRAATLLGEAVASDPASQKALIDEFLKNPAYGPLYWLANSLEAEPPLKEAIAKTPPAELVKLLGSNDWVVMQAVARALGHYAADARKDALDACVQQSGNGLELIASVWCARGCTLGEKARDRVRKLLGIKQDSISSAAARWLGGAEEVKAAELDAVWEAAQLSQPNTGFFIAALDLISRPEIAPRLEEKARTTMGASGNVSATQQALAAAVLKGRATAKDLTQAAERIKGAKDHALAGKLAALFTGCTTLEENGINRFVGGLTDNDAVVRRRYLRALRECAVEMRSTICQRALEKIDTTAGSDPAKEPPALKLARISVDGILAGTGGSQSLDRLLQAAEGDKADIAKTAGAALVDALDADGLATTLNNLKKKPNVKFGLVVVQAAYMELCSRAVEAGDADAFRVSQAKALSVKKDYDWELQNWMQERMNELRQGRADFDLKLPLPRDPVLTELKIAP